jgi:hypothetical protein
VSEYQLTVLLGIGKIAVWSFVFLYLAPKLLFATRAENSLETFFLGFVKMSFATICLVLVLSALGIYDIFLLMAGYAAIYITRLALAGSPRKYFRKTVTRSSFAILNTLEQTETRTDFVLWLKRQSARMKPRLTKQSIWTVTLIIILLFTALLRLRPTFEHAAPFSLNVYANVDLIQQLRANEIPVGQLLSNGVIVFIEFFSQLARLNPFLIAHTLGALSSVLLVLAIFFSIQKATGSRGAGVLGAAMFGMFSTFLPVNLSQQVEANAMIFSVTFVLLSLIFFADYITRSKQRSLVGFLAGLVITFTLSIVAGIILVILATIAMTLAVVLSAGHAVRVRKTTWFVLGIVILLEIALGYGFVALLQQDSGAAQAIRQMLYDPLVEGYAKASFIIPEIVLFGAAFLVGGLLLFSRLFAEQKETSYHSIVWGIGLMLMAVLWGSQHVGLPRFIYPDQVSLAFSSIACIAVGTILYHTLFRFARRLMLAVAPSGVRRKSVTSTFTSLVFFSTLFSGGQQFEYAKIGFTTEPDKFVEMVYMIENTFQPYQFTVVSHLGTKPQVVASGRFMDYNYFLQNYKPETYGGSQQQTIPTNDVFIFALKKPNDRNVMAELMPYNTDNPIRSTLDWCRTYRQHHANMSIFYDDEDVCIYRISQ